MSTVSLQVSEKMHQPILVMDYSKPILETITEDVEIVKPDMKVISERYNPFFKKTVFTIEREMVTGYHCAGRFFDYLKAVWFAKKYARENGLKYSI